MTTAKPATPLPWGAFDSEGKLRARFESETEAHFYVKGRSHMHGGSHREIGDAYPLLVTALRLVTGWHAPELAEIDSARALLAALGEE